MSFEEQAKAFVDHYTVEALAPEKPFGQGALNFFFRLALLRVKSPLASYILREVLHRKPEWHAEALEIDRLGIPPDYDKGKTQ